MTKNTSEAKVNRILQKSDPITRIAGQSDAKVSDQSYFEVYELVLDKDGDEETKLLISGNEVFIALQASLLPAIQQLIRAELARADLGTFVGYPYAEYVQNFVAPLSVEIHWRLSGTRPYEPSKEVKRLGNRTPPRPYLNIPNIHRNKCTWENILAVAGGENGYIYGNHYAVARMVDKDTDKIGRGGQMKAYASSQNAAREIIERTAELSKSKIISLVGGEDLKAKMQKPRVRVHPAWFVIYGSRRSKDGSDELSAIGGKKIPLGFKPADVRETIRKSLER
ncbi:hypothetical protein QUB63_17035 [Microcoleus sp. ARI1-B5]|uniref:hypothetical protein n=1 Tax=unclassified Microcoleus TaxID=2642155 RepID=UPI002FD18359